MNTNNNGESDEFDATTPMDVAHDGAADNTTSHAGKDNDHDSGNAGSDGRAGGDRTADAVVDDETTVVLEATQPLGENPLAASPADARPDGVNGSASPTGTGTPDGTPTGNPDGTPTGNPDGTPSGIPTGVPAGDGASPATIVLGAFVTLFALVALAVAILGVPMNLLSGIQVNNLVSIVLGIVGLALVVVAVVVSVSRSKSAPADPSGR
ncbi:hypothetical protein [Bifidobacterium choloepi]|uniref:Uncharacterized protein n=1 Tax=Bifidobacterium choloepi TaxID=2614131 RepID=A0A6I5MZG4_9BIFI|nr:hypothetical protein [Bifidobacterium choloepi]NEG69606.1 hypothetical protein [Bifidobacterium choloepi]